MADRRRPDTTASVTGPERSVGQGFCASRTGTAGTWPAWQRKAGLRAQAHPDKAEALADLQAAGASGSPEPRRRRSAETGLRLALQTLRSRRRSCAGRRFRPCCATVAASLLGQMIWWSCLQLHAAQSVRTRLLKTKPLPSGRRRHGAAQASTAV